MGAYVFRLTFNGKPLKYSHCDYREHYTSCDLNILLLQNDFKDTSNWEDVQLNKCKQKMMPSLIL